MRKKFMATPVTQSKKRGAEGYVNLLAAVDFPAGMPNCHIVTESVCFRLRQHDQAMDLPKS
jgi:hypothetical protein